jgi:hypothetical protein
MKQFVLCLAALGLICLSVAGCSKQAATSKTADTQTDGPGADTTRPVKNRDSVTIELTGADSATVFDLLKARHRVDYLSTAGGVFVKSIDSVANGTSVFWIYSVNDTNPKVAADRMLTRTGDRVVWHFRKMGE